MLPRQRLAQERSELESLTLSSSTRLSAGLGRALAWRIGIGRLVPRLGSCTDLKYSAIGRLELAVSQASKHEWSGRKRRYRGNIVATMD